MTAPTPAGHPAWCRRAHQPGEQHEGQRAVLPVAPGEQQRLEVFLYQPAAWLPGGRAPVFVAVEVWEHVEMHELDRYPEAPEQVLILRLARAAALGRALGRLVNRARREGAR